MAAFDLTDLLKGPACKFRKCLLAQEIIAGSPWEKDFSDPDLNKIEANDRLYFARSKLPKYIGYEIQFIKK